MSRGRLFRGALLLLLLAFFPACSPGGGDEVVLEFWAMGREGEVVQELMPEFERRNPGVRVKVQQIPWNAAHEKILTAYVGESTPDVAQLGNTWVAELVALGGLEPLEPWIARSPTVDPAAFFPGVWETNLVDGVTYGLPWYVDTRLLFYRADLLRRVGYEKPPETWAEWLDSMRRLKALPDGPRYPVLLETNDWRSPVILGLQAGSPIVGEGGRRGAFSEPAFEEAFRFYVQLFREGLAPPVSANRIPNVYQAFADGTIAMFLTGPWNIGEFGNRLPPDLQDRWMTAALPGPDGPGVSVAGGASLVVFESARHKAAAWALMEYLVAPEQQIRFYELTGDLPTREDAWEHPVLAENPYAAPFRAQLDRVVTTPTVPEWEQIAARVTQYAEQAVLGRLTEAEALAALDRDVDRILEKRRWILARREAEEADGDTAP